jgi:CCR4-NOT transcription complex subunit 3
VCPSPFTLCSPFTHSLTMRSDLAPKPPPNPNFAQQPMSSILKAGLPTSQPRPPLKYATAAAAAVTPSASQQSNASLSSSTTAPPAPVPAPAPAPPPPKPEPVVNTALQDHITAVTSSPSLTQISTSSPFLSSTSASAQQPDGSFGSPLVSEAESHLEPSTSVSSPSPLGAGEFYLILYQIHPFSNSVYGGTRADCLDL